MTNSLLLAALLALTLPLQNAERRVQAARQLREQLELAEVEGTLAAWVDAARSTAKELGPGPFSSTLEQAVLDARWLEFTDPKGALRNLESELRAAAVDLEFTPIVEAELPEGFPAPTPVREIELKSYPAYRRVRADMSGSGSTGAFFKLFQHIQRNDIAMTAPVEMNYDEQGGAWRETEMSFLYAKPDLGSAGPAGSVEVVDEVPAIFASIGCRGRMSRANIEAAGLRLMRWIEGRTDLAVAGELRSMGYNSPMVPGSRTFFEVQVPVRQRLANPTEQVVIDFGVEADVERFAPVNDSVMGGRSTSRFVTSQEHTAVFEGNLSLENNGGFASVRTRPGELDLAGAAALVLAFRGDGKTYKLRLRTDDRWDGVSYEAVFPTDADTWQTHRFPIDEFVPVWRGRRVRDARALAPEDVRTLGLMISDKQVGRFRLEVRSLAKE